MKKNVKGISALMVLIVMLLTGLSITAKADIPYNSYTYWTDISEEDKAVINRQMYAAEKLITAETIGVENFNQINDICIDEKGNIYILDHSSRIVIIDNNYSLVREIGCINGNIEYNEAKGLYVERNGTIYICDTNHHRLLHINQEGGLIREIGIPESPLIPDDFNYAPISMVTDDNGYFYVLSDGSFHGALLFSPELEFMGFYGANSVKGSLSSIFTNIKNKIISNNDKKANSKQNLPYCFVDITIDKNGFIYTCNGYTNRNEKTGQVRKLSPGTGLNVLENKDNNFADSETNGEYNKGILTKQDVMNVEVDQYGFIFGLESAYGKIFLYDKTGVKMSVFGGGIGMGTQKGTFVNASSMAVRQDGERVYVADKRTNYITAFAVTEFGKSVRNATILTVNGKYKASESIWENVLNQDQNYQPAYSAIAHVKLDEKNYAEAMKYAKIGYDREVYAAAFENERSRFLYDNFLVIFSAVLFFAVFLIVLLVVKSKKHIVLIKNKQIKTMLTVLIHPVNVFADIKEKHLGSNILCAGTTLLFYVSTILQTLAGGFMFSKYDNEQFNSLWIFVRSIGLVVLWIIADWMVCTLLGGTGTLKEITVVTCYSLWPLILSNFLKIILTNVLVPNEANFLSILNAIAIIYFLILMLIGLLKIHDFSLSRLIGTSVLSIIGIAAIIFLIIMVSILVQQFWAFIVTIASEISTL